MTDESYTCKTEHVFEGVMSAKKLIELIKKTQRPGGKEIPKDAKIELYITVPGGGDWSNCELSVDRDVKLQYTVKWSENTVVTNDEVWHIGT